ncbi:putative ABC transporter C family member 15 [Vitis vinifera]|uniref:Putative ABC transporter C family member 15 n=1 Tax=Vitis vinifera TaxID=29760 RepID=A0A438CHG3_VITVI|nr:putative ABC transporter C family member 15 [Vitis vinifera]
MNIGLGSLAALAATLMVMACNIPLTRIQKRYQSKIMEAKDERMKATSEVLRNIKTLKLQAWDSQFLHKPRKLEENRVQLAVEVAKTGSTFCFYLLGITHVYLCDPIFNLPDLLSVIAQGKVSVDRVASFLQEDEVQSDTIEFVPKDQTEFEVEIDNGKFSWNPDSSSPTLDKIQRIKKAVGYCKDWWYKGLCTSVPMDTNRNVKENILFGNRYDSVKYDETVKACALTKDFELFPCGDLTEIGERGINMSGGQKQRIQIARAVYEDADIYLLDDPFSAVDAHTGTQLFKDCLMGILKNKTILYVTHQVEFLPAADFILVASNYWMAWASPPTSESRPKMGLDYILFVYILLAVGSSLFVLLRASLVAITGLSTAQKLFVKMLQSVVRAPMAFFDSTPTGRILNRVSSI